MHDAHVHLDFMANGEQVAADANAAGTLLFANTVSPDGFNVACARFGGFDNVRIGWGMHPWWVDETSAQTVQPVPASIRYVGEVGLDFGRRHAETHAAQLEVFRTIACTCSEQGGKIISLHSVHAARETLDELEACGALESCTCLFHWFTGPSDQLKRAIDAGCYFSVGPRMVATAKGCEYVKAIPSKQLLLETDAPPGQDVEYSHAELCRELDVVSRAIASIKGEGALEVIDDTFTRLFA
ncbi:MAG: TatD family hydrolase [Eggerthellaceae bacterium]|nr:TatD family hydrolase [Eggerthellaceae bacterium]